MANADIIVTPVSGKADFKAFIDLAYRLNASDPAWVPPLRGEVEDLLTPGKNPFHEHATMQLFLARRGAKVTGRISAKSSIGCGRPAPTTSTRPPGCRKNAG